MEPSGENRLLGERALPSLLAVARGKVPIAGGKLVTVTFVRRGTIIQRQGQKLFT